MSTHLTLAAGAEFDVIRRLLFIWGPVAHGIGDDAAVLDVPLGEQLVASVDASVEHVHFRREWFTPEEIGSRAAMAALSDLSAMASTPRGLLLALGVPERWRADLDAVGRGVGKACAAAGCPILGGNIAASDVLTLTITVLGTTARPLRRSGARVGDRVFVTGALGGPAAALEALRRGAVPDPAHRLRFASPVARLGEAKWLAEHGASAGIDISDGLRGDAAHLARASGVTIAIREGAVPRMSGVSPADAMSGGEEYELLVTVPAIATFDVAEFTSRYGTPLTEIGAVVLAGRSALTVDGVDADHASIPASHDHLA